MYGPDLITAVSAPDRDEGSDLAPVPRWSFGKTVLAAAALVLADRNRLELDRPYPEGFTLRQLLQHRAGLPDYGALPAYQAAAAAGDPPWSLPELLARTESARLRYAPGTGWAYSNVGYALVRDAIERAADAPLGVALARLLFEPLDIAGMRVATEPDSVRGCWGVVEGYHPGQVYHGLLVGPAASAARFLRLLASGNMLSPAAFAAMREVIALGGPVPDRPWRTANYGLGLMVGSGADGRIYAGHTGGGPGSVCAVYSCRPGRAAAAFLRRTAPGPVEAVAFVLARRLRAV